MSSSLEDPKYIKFNMEKQNSNYMMICLNGKRTVFPVKLKLQEESSG